MPLEIIREDITRMHVDAIVAASNPRLKSDGGVNGAIHHAAGPDMDVACRALGGCRTGEAKITSGFRLPCRYVIHTVGPVWRGGFLGEPRKLAQCYASSLALARQHGVKSIAFPVISAGLRGFPPMQALRIATDAIRDFLMGNDMHVYLVLFDQDALQQGAKLYSNIREYIDDHYVAQHTEPNRILNTAPYPYPSAPCAAPSMTLKYQHAAGYTLEAALGMIDESFSEMVLRLIDERGWKDSACYKRANIDRKHFAKIRKEKQYRPKKSTAIALAIALELPLDQTKELLMKAGYALSHSSKADIIVEYFIVHGKYDVDEINIALMEFDQPILGG